MRYRDDLLRHSITLLMCNVLLAGQVKAEITLPGSCDPKIQSCIPRPGGPGAPGTCSPSPGGATCDSPAPASLAVGGGVNLGAGNPINVVTGNKYQQETDMPALPGVLGLELVRHYNSAFSLPHHPNGIAGRGWKLSYETDLHATGRTIQIVQADGSRIIFDRDPRDPGLCSSANPAHGTLRITPTSRGDEYRWVWPDGRILSFSPEGKLLQIAVPSGEFVSLTYDHKGVLLAVTDPQGRSLRLQYLDIASARKADRFRGVQHIDTPVGRFGYEYGRRIQAQATARLRDALANLVTVRGPGGDVRRYHYEDSRHPTLLTGISAGRAALQRVATYGYDEYGKAVLTVRGLPARMKSNADGRQLGAKTLVDGTGVEQVTLDTRVGGQTVISNSLGKKTIYRHGIVGGQYRLLEVRGAGCAGCGETNVRYGYDAIGRLVRTTKLSRSGVPLGATLVDLDGGGRVVRVSRIDYRDGKELAPVWLERYEYIGSSPLRQLIARPSVVAGREAQTRIRYNDRGQPLELTESGWAPPVAPGLGPLPLTRTVSYRYSIVNGRSVLAELDGPLPNGPSASPSDSDITRLEWDAKGNVVSALTAPGRFRTSVVYDAAGRIAAVAGPDGRQSKFSYDVHSRLATLDVGGFRRLFHYDEQGNTIEVGHQEGDRYQPTHRFGYDGVGRLTWRASHLGFAEVHRFDTEGKLLESSRMSASFRQTRRYTYDDVGQITAIADDTGATRRIGWDERGLPTVATDSLGRERRFYYDALGQLDRLVDAANTVQARLNDTAIRLGRDALGRVVSITTPNGVQTRQVRDDFGRVIATISADGGTLLRVYDAADQLIGSTDANGNRAEYEYDVGGRIARQHVLDARAGTVAERRITTTWHYDGLCLSAVDHPSQTERYTYDANGQTSSKTVTLKFAGGRAVSSRTEYGYDDMGRLTSMSLPDGSVIEYRRNGQHQVVALERSRIRTRWLRWLLPSQVIVHNLERDIAGLRSAEYGNGIRSRYHRSPQGVLARVEYRALRPSRTAATAAGAGLAAIIGARPALAAGQAPGGAAARAEKDGSAAAQSALPGAFVHQRDSATLLDYRYLWDTEGNLLYQEGNGEVSSYAYDAQNRLIATATASKADGAASYSRYFNDGAGNRLLSQEGVASQADTATGTVSARYTGASNRLLETVHGEAALFDANGQLRKAGKREYRWDALGRLREVREAGHTIAHYRYDHRGLRISKQAGNSTRHFLYEGRQIAAELNHDGTVARQYIYLAGQPVAVLDNSSGSVPVGRNRGTLMQIGSDISTALGAWFSDSDTTAYLHTNHLGAVEAATDARGQQVWRASYQPYGKVAVHGDARNDFQFNLRLPGQYEDAETGLYYNDHRYYDPAQGRYLTPDPLGPMGGLNNYVYADGNPLKYIDPSGLILFAFDGTGNGENPGPDSSLSNVWKFMNAYDKVSNGLAFYITGIGTTNMDMPIAGNVATGSGFDERVALGFTFLDRYIDLTGGQAVLDIDVVGFSRGAAEARVWLNELVKHMPNGQYTSASGKTRCLNLRFQGLFDTVPHLGPLNGDEKQYDFGIPAAVKHVAHAVALNEHRGEPIDFDVRSILKWGQQSSPHRIEQGFIGAHSDIGGGYPSGDLSDVALMWMIMQAERQGIKFKNDVIIAAGWDSVTLPIVHDSSLNALFEAERAPEYQKRDIVYADGKTVKHGANVVFGGATTAGTKRYIDYFPFTCAYTNSPSVGMVNMAMYREWVRRMGVDIAYLQPAPPRSCL